jgi:hypothetical protein
MSRVDGMSAFTKKAPGAASLSDFVKTADVDFHRFQIAVDAKNANVAVGPCSFLPAEGSESYRWDCLFARKSSTGRRSHATGASRRLKAKPQLLSCPANAIIEAEKLHTRDAGTSCQRRRQVNRV